MWQEDGGWVSGDQHTWGFIAALPGWEVLSNIWDKYKTLRGHGRKVGIYPTHEVEPFKIFKQRRRIFCFVFFSNRNLGDGFEGRQEMDSPVAQW